MDLSAPSAAVEEFFAKCPGVEPRELIRKMEILKDFLYETNLQVNLTAIPAEKFWSLHAADSLSAAYFFPDIFRGGSEILDLGCGAGFPSLVLAAAFPDIRVTSIDSTLKKIRFVQAAAERLSLSNLSAVHGRGNELARKAPFKGHYDAVFARAVASAEILIREGMSFLKPGGSLIVYRTLEQYGSELEFLKKWKKGKFRGTASFDLPDQAGKRMFLQIKQMREMH